MTPSPLSVMFIAGDVSGDIHASPVVRQFLQDYPGAQIWGIGGPRMQEQSFDAIMPFQPFNKMGFVEVLRNLPFFLNARKKLRSEMAKRKPDCLVCVDYPGLNMLMMKDAHKLGIPVIWYIAPMVWAWKQKRAVTLAQYASHIACIFPFEVKYFSAFTSQVSFVGNPLIEAIENDEFTKQEQNGKLHLAIVPGSRWQEVKKTLIPMVQTFQLLKNKFPELQGSISHCADLPLSFYEDVSRNTGLKIVKEPLRALLSRSDLALVTSGTATLEAALLGVPMVSVYKTSWLNYSIFKHVLKIPYISLPNIIAGERVIAECIQNDMTPSVMAKELSDIICNEKKNSFMKSRLGEIKRILGSKKPSTELSLILKNIVSSHSQV